MNKTSLRVVFLNGESIARFEKLLKHPPLAKITSCKRNPRPALNVVLIELRAIISVYLSICLSTCLTVYPSIYLSNKQTQLFNKLDQELVNRPKHSSTSNYLTNHLIIIYHTIYLLLLGCLSICLLFWLYGTYAYWWLAASHCQPLSVVFCLCVCLHGWIFVNAHEFVCWGRYVGMSVSSQASVCILGPKSHDLMFCCL